MFLWNLLLSLLGFGPHPAALRSAPAARPHRAKQTSPAPRATQPAPRPADPTPRSHATVAPAPPPAKPAPPPALQRPSDPWLTKLPTPSPSTHPIAAQLARAGISIAAHTEPTPAAVHAAELICRPAARVALQQALWAHREKRGGFAHPWVRDEQRRSEAHSAMRQLHEAGVFEVASAHTSRLAPGVLPLAQGEWLTVAALEVVRHWQALQQHAAAALAMVQTKWAPEAGGGTMEFDLIVHGGRQLILVEAKAGRIGNLNIEATVRRAERVNQAFRRHRLGAVRYVVLVPRPEGKEVGAVKRFTDELGARGVEVVTLDRWRAQLDEAFGIVGPTP